MARSSLLKEPSRVVLDRLKSVQARRELQLEAKKLKAKLMRRKVAPKKKKTSRPQLPKRLNWRTKKKKEEVEVAVIVAEIITVVITEITVTALKTITAAVVQFVFPHLLFHHRRHHLLQQLQQQPKQQLQQQSLHHHHQVANDQFVNVCPSVHQNELISRPSQEF